MSDATSSDCYSSSPSSSSTNSDVTLTGDDPPLVVLGTDGHLAHCCSSLSSANAGEVYREVDLLMQELESVRPKGYTRKNTKSSSTTSSASASPLKTNTRLRDNMPAPAAACGGPHILEQPASSAVAKDTVNSRPPRPVVPPKPQMDTYRYSKVNLEESQDVDLDALLGELSALESQLNESENSVVQLFSPAHRQASPHVAPKPSPSSRLPLGANYPPVTHSTTHASTPTGPALPLTDGASRLAGKAVQQQPLWTAAMPGVVPLSTTSSSSSSSSTATVGAAPRTGTPEGDAESGFCDGASMFSNESAQMSVGAGSLAHRSRDSNVSSTESSRGSLNTPSPTQQPSDGLSSVVSNGACMTAHRHHHLDPVPESSSPVVTPASSVALPTLPQQLPLTDAERIAQLKAEKIKIALEKMKEANIKKLYVKFFTGDGGSKSLLVDERSTVTYVLRQLAEKLRLQLTAHFAVVETYPDLYMERIYEDNEYLVENILMWTRDSSNKLSFVERPDKYRLFAEPQLYLVSKSSSERSATLDGNRKQQLIEEFFTPTHIQPPEIEGWLYLKADGRKAWKRHYFVLRASGVYYIPKGKSTKSSKDLVCLMNLEMIQIYNAVGWKKKYKAPTDFGFALKHPQIQVKASKYIKYLCAEDEQTLQRWMVGLRIAKSGRQIFDNYEAMKTYLESADVTDSVGNSKGSGSASLRSSASSENCHHPPPLVVSVQNGTDGYNRENMIIRPGNASHHSPAEADIEVKLRSKSADVHSRNSTTSSCGSTNAGGKRNSGLLKVELPTIPQEHDEQDHHQQTTVSRRSQQQQENGVMSTSANSSLSYQSANGVAYYNQQQQMNANNGTGPYTVNGGVQRLSGSQTPTSNGDGGRDTDSGSLAFERDSFVTGTIKRQPADLGNRSASGGVLLPPQMALSKHQRRQSQEGGSSVHSGGRDSTGAGAEVDSDEEEFPPPPPPIYEVQVSQPAPVGSRLSTSSGGEMRSPPATAGSRPLSSTSRNAPPISPQPPTPQGGQKKRPPPPPKRNENTKLLTAAVSPLELKSATQSRGAPPPAPPPKPQLQTQNSGGDFQSELQLAMAKRLKKIAPHTVIHESGPQQ